MKKYLSTSAVKIIGIVIALCVAGYGFLVQVIMPTYIQKMLPVAEDMAKEYINGSVKIGGLTWNGGLTAEVENVIVKDLQDKKVVVLPKAKVRLRPWMALLKPERALSKIELSSPEVFLRLREDQKWNTTTILKPSDSEETPFYGLLEIEKGKLNVETPYGEWNFSVDGSVDGGANPKFALDTKLKTKSEEIKLSGLVTTKGIGKLQANTQRFGFGNYASLIKHYTNIIDFGGEILDTHVLWENDGKKTAVSGKVSFADLGGKVVVSNEKHSFALNGKVKAADSILDVDKINALIDNSQELYLTGKADVHDVDNIGGQGLITSPRLVYKDYALEQLKLPFTLSKQLMQIDKASVNYGGGVIRASATADLRDNSLTGDLFLDKVSHALSSKDGDIVHANGTVAILGRAEEKNGESTFQIHAAADTFKLQWQDLLVNKVVLDGDFNGDVLNIDHFSAWTGDGVLALKGQAGFGADRPLALEGRIADFGIGPALYHFADIEGKGKLSMNFNVGGTTTSPEFATLVQLREVEVLNHKLMEMHGNVSMKNKLLEFKRIGATQTQGRHFLDGTIDLAQQDPVFNLELRSKNVRVEPIVSLITKDFSLTGNLDNSMHITGTSKHPRVEGEMALTDGSVQTYLLNGISGKYLYDDGFVNLKDFIVKLLIADVNFSGTMTKEQALDFDIAAKNINVAKSPYKDPNFSIEGLLDLKGHVTGYLKNPYFEGNVASDSLELNGELYTDISGSVSSNMQAKNYFDISFKQPHRNAKGEAVAGVGIFQANGNLNLAESFLAGTVDIKDGDIAGLLRTNKLDYAVNGYVDGLVNICPEGKGSGINYVLESKNISTHKLQYEKMQLKGNYKKNMLTINEALLQEKANVSDRGFIQAFGTINFDSKLLDLKAKARGANPAIVNVVMKDYLDIKGALNLDALVTGSLEEPKGNATAEVLTGSVLGVNFDRAAIALDMVDDNIYIKEVVANKDVYGIAGKGKIPMDALRAKNERKNPNAEMDIAIDLDKTELGILTASRYFDWGTGDIKGNISIKGTLEEPKVYGSINVEDGTVKVHDVHPVLEHVKLNATFDGDKAELHSLDMQTGKKGNIALNGYYYFSAPDDIAYKFNVSAKDAEVSYSTMFKGKLNSELEITPQAYRDYWHKNITPQSNASTGKAFNKGAKRNIKMPINLGPRFRSEQYRPLIKGKIRLDDVVANVLGVADSEVGSETNLGLDMKVELGPKIHMLNAMFYDIWLSGGLDIKGGYFTQTSADENADEKIIKLHNMGPDRLNIDGKIVADKGSITYLRTVFKITDAELSWIQPGEILPYVKLDSWARFGKYRMFIKIDGSLGDIKNDEILKLTSSPPLEKNTIIRMLTLQRESASGGNDLTNDDLNNVMNAGLQMALLGNVELWVKQTLGLDQFRIYTGKVNAGITFDGSDTKKQLTTEEKNRYNILISKYLTDNFMIGYTSNFNANERVLFGQYDLGKHFNITYSEKQKLDGERKHWAGIEYRIDFK